MVRRGPFESVTAHLKERLGGKSVSASQATVMCLLGREKRMGRARERAESESRE